MPWPLETFRPPADFDEAAYGDALTELRRFLAAFARAAPAAAVTRGLLTDLQRWRKELEAYRVAADEGPYGQVSALPDHALASLPQLVVEQTSPEVMVAEVTFSRWHLGAGGVVHGGQVATAIDELMGRMRLAAGSVARTAYLTVNYRAATPYERQLGIEIRVVREDGRKVLLKGRLFDSTTTYADAEALFVHVAPYPGRPSHSSALAAETALETP